MNIPAVFYPHTCLLYFVLLFLAHSSKLKSLSAVTYLAKLTIIITHIIITELSWQRLEIFPNKHSWHISLPCVSFSSYYVFADCTT